MILAVALAVIHQRQRFELIITKNLINSTMTKITLWLKIRQQKLNHVVEKR